MGSSALNPINPKYQTLNPKPVEFERLAPSWEEDLSDLKAGSTLRAVYGLGRPSRGRAVKGFINRV